MIITKLLVCAGLGAAFSAGVVIFPSEPQDKAPKPVEFQRPAVDLDRVAIALSK
ncbi:MAG TPA: hypothetical protein VF774_21665 [Pseudoduganella sp.]